MKVISSRDVTGDRVKFLMMFLSITLISNIANFWPMQFLVPAEKAMKA